jgi:hypothetical protein
MNTSSLEVERPFALTAIGWLTAAAGLMLVVGTLYRVTAGRADSTAKIALGAGVVEMLIGATMGFGARWAYWPIRVLTPINFVVAAALGVAGSSAFLIWALFFGGASLILWGPDRVAGRFQDAIRRWREGVPSAVGPTPVTRAEPGAEGRLAA